ncbi:hypothetical protein, partial [Streptomyces sp. NPDC057052]|uniref:hypothetical protein n=1 Tax=Streptomyces sp. NPDC057052 TaxID=3346010 RepID=UPI00363397C1
GLPADGLTGVGSGVPDATVRHKTHLVEQALHPAPPPARQPRRRTPTSPERRRRRGKRKNSFQERS